MLLLTLALFIQPAQAQTPAALASLEQYFLAAEGTNVLQRLTTLESAKRAIFAQTDTPTYVASLEYLDRVRGAHPQAVLDLAVALQQYWENEFGAALTWQGASSLDRVESDEKLGFILGMSALLATLSRHPERFNSYCLLFRGLFPMAGMLAYRSDRPDPRGSPIPPAPAQILRLGIPRSAELDPQLFARDQSLRAFELTAMSISAGALATDITAFLMAARTGSTVLRLNPVSFVVGTAVLYAVEEGAEYAIDRAETARFESNFRIAIENLRRAARQGDPAQIYERAQRLATRSSELAAFRNRDLWLAAQTAAQNVQDGSTTSEAAMRQLSALIARNVRESWNRGSDSETGFLVRILLKSGLTSHELTEPRHISLAQGYEARFARWAANLENQTRINWDEIARASAWIQFLQGADLRAEQHLIDRLGAGQLPEHPSVVLWTAVAVLRSLHLDYLEPTIDMLKARIGRNRLITLPTGGRP